LKPVVISAAEAAALIHDGAFVAIQGSGGGVGEPTAVLRAIRRRFDVGSGPRGITVCHSAGLGDLGEIGADLLAVPGLVGRLIAGHLGMSPRMARMALDNQVEAYNFPQGVLTQMYGAVAARKPGVFSKVGLGAFVDPRLRGGRMNAVTTEELVRVMEIDGEEWLFFPRFHIDVALVRGTTADLNGNIASEQEPALLDGAALAQAGRASGGIVIAQVKHLARAGTLDPRRVRIPGIAVDYIVVDPTQRQTSLSDYEPAFSGEVRIPLDSLEPLPLDVRKVIARRAARELFQGAVVNLGYGVPAGVASVATEEGIIDDLTLTVEQGVVGGQPAQGVVFGVSYNPEAILRQDDLFNLYDGGAIDIAFLGLAQADPAGNVNVSQVGDLLAGCGGFINISQNARKVVFCGTLTTKGLRCEVGGGRLRILEEGRIRKFVERVDQITYSGETARAMGQDALFVTERAVFRLERDGLTVIEAAPGVDLEREVLGQMAFRPRVASDLREMDAAIFTE